MIKRCMPLAALSAALALCGCAAPHQASYDYTAYKESRPASILVLPPLNESPDVKASDGLLSRVTQPLAESGYYVFPVALVEETFRQNGLPDAHDAQKVDVKKLREIFGADAALYLTVSEYGSKYQVVSSSITVSASALLVDLRTGKKLWEGSARASSNENNNNNSGGLLGMLIVAAVSQVLNSTTNASVNVAGVAASRLLTASKPTGMLYGPRSGLYKSD